jgi:acetyl-CoA carboxylase biotin carboxyl carrier protein
MNIKEIKQLVKLMIDNDLNELDITDGDNSVHLKRGIDGVPVMVPAAAVAPATQAPEAPAAEQDVDDGFLEITSPMVGTFYLGEGPDSDPYVRVGDQIDDAAVVCIVEAMKVMNEIKAECAGTIAEICIENAQPVEFGQVLFRVRPL